LLFVVETTDPKPNLLGSAFFPNSDHISQKSNLSRD